VVVMDIRREVEDLLTRWARVTQAREPERAADLFQRDPAPLVTFTDGERAADWLDVRIRIARDLERAIVDNISVHHLDVREISEDAFAASFVYELTVRDVWGLPSTVTRLASMTLVRTKDGLRIATAHFSVPPS
jgi:hypothetical protein